MTALRKIRMSYADYLAAERTATSKHEYLRGEVWAMAGGSLEHARLAAAMIRELGNALASRPCRVFTSDARVRILATDRATYPDVSVVCGPIETAPDDPDALTNPVLLVEVLSETTETADRIEKFAHYRHIPSLREYVLVSQKARRVEVYRREGDVWVLREASSGERFDLASVECTIALDAVYREPSAGG